MGQQALKLEPAGELISISEIAKRTKLNRATVASRLEDLGYEPDEVNPKGPNAKLFRFDSEMEFALKSAKDTVSAMKIRDLRVTAELKELKLAEARGELVPMHEVVEIVQKIGTSIYQEFTVRQPKRIGPKLAKAKNVTEVKKILKVDTTRVMKVLRENFEGFIA